MNRIRWAFAAFLVSLLLAGCGGSDGSRYDRMVVFGDSLSDVGTYNVGDVAALGAATGGAGRFTINSSSGGQIWVEQLAALLGMGAGCAAETGLSPNIPGMETVAITAHPGCFNYAQGGSRVTHPAGPSSVALQAAGAVNIGLTAKPVAQQMAAHLAAAGGRYSGRELVTVLAGANDIFMELVLTAPSDPLLAVANAAAAGRTLGQLVRTQVLDRGAVRVLVLTLPDIAHTPYVVSLEPLQPGIVELTDTMVQAFNAQLVAQLQGYASISLGDAYLLNRDQLLHPARYGLSNVTTPACGPNALGSTSLVCNASNTIAADVSRYLFADDVHPTPYGHSLLTDLAEAALTQISVP